MGFRAQLVAFGERNLIMKYVRRNYMLGVHQVSELPPPRDEVMDSMQVTLLSLWLTLRNMKFYGSNMTPAEKETRKNESISHCTATLKSLMDLIFAEKYYNIPRTLYEVEISMMIRRYLDDEDFEVCDHFVDDLPEDLLKKTLKDIWG